MDEKKRRKRKFIYTAELMGIFLLAGAVLAAGSAIVSVNCHNAMYSDRMVLFDVEKRGDVIAVTVMDKEYLLEW